MLGEVKKLNGNLMASCFTNIRIKNYLNLLLSYNLKCSGCF